MAIRHASRAATAAVLGQVRPPRRGDPPPGAAVPLARRREGRARRRS